MSKVSTMIKLLKSPRKLIYPMGSIGILNWMPDDKYLKVLFHNSLGYQLDLKSPKTFNEKLQWLKIHDHNPQYSRLVDKIEAKKIVGDIIGQKHIVPIYGEWKTANEIPFDLLPEQFVLKCNHDQGSVILIADKNRIDKQEISTFLNRKIKYSVFNGTREYPYKNIIPRIFAEEYLGKGIIDYKFYCFNGEPKFLYCGKGLTEDHSLKIDFYDLEWHQMPFYRADYKRLGQIPKPEHFEEMILIAQQLSKDVPFVRIDLFEVNHNIYFSEFTLYPASGLMPFVPEQYDRIIGDWLELPVR